MSAISVSQWTASNVVAAIGCGAENVGAMRVVSGGLGMAVTGGPSGCWPLGFALFAFHLLGLLAIACCLLNNTVRAGCDLVCLKRGGGGGRRGAGLAVIRIGLGGGKLSTLHSK